MACSKRSDSGERRELGKASEKTRGDWREGDAVSPFFPRLFRLLFSAPLPYSSRLSPLSERLEQATGHTNVCILSDRSIWKPDHTNVCILFDRSIIWKLCHTNVCILSDRSIICKPGHANFPILADRRRSLTIAEQCFQRTMETCL